MTITADWQGDLGGVTFGSGTSYALAGRINVGVPAVRPVEMARGQDHGTVATDDRLGSRVIQIPLAIRRKGNAANANALLTTLRAAWKPASADQELTLRLPGSPETVMSYFGRPRGLDAVLDPGLFPAGSMQVLATFDALDPLEYGASQSSNNNTGAFTITNDGNAPSKRCTITLTANGSGAVTLANTSEPDSATLTWSSTLAAATVRVIDLRACTVTTAAGATKISELAAGSNFFSLLAGANNLVATNCSDVDVTWRDAWY